MLPLCLDAHATPSHQNGDRAPCNPPSARQHPLIPSTAPGSPAVQCPEYTHKHEAKVRKKERITESAKRDEENKDPQERFAKQ